MTLAALLDRLVGRIERAEILDGPADALASFTESATQNTVVTNLLSGTPLGHPAHPLLVAIPLGSWTSAVVFDVTGDEHAATTLTGVGILAAAPAVVTGLSDWCYTNGGERRVGFVHAMFNSAALAAYVGSWLARVRGKRLTGIALSGVGGMALTAGGWLGGHMAYALGVGVDTTAFQHGSEEWTAVADADAVEAGELTAASVNGVALVLTRDDAGQIVALSDRCTHRGAPLHEGEVSNGCIVCPWHQSEFALDGTVVRGPAVRPQPAYETRVDGNRVSVRRVGEERTLRTNPVSH
jgi:nitrite reductase/ring-hydroxylating ferredoxin subunit/uncharacterized membrane protein